MIPGVPAANRPVGYTESVLAGPFACKPLKARAGSHRWECGSAGSLLIVIDRSKKATLLRVADETTGANLLEAELPFELRYLVLTRTFHALELEDGMLGLAFATEMDAFTWARRLEEFRPRPSAWGLPESLSTGSIVAGLTPPPGYMAGLTAGFSPADGAERASPGEGSRSSTGSAAPAATGSQTTAATGAAAAAGADPGDGRRRGSLLNRVGALFGFGGGASGSNAANDEAAAAAALKDIASGLEAGREVQIGGVVPGTLKHEGHVGLTDEGTFSVSNIPAEWRHWFRELGVSKRELARDPDLARSLFAVLQDAPAVVAQREKAVQREREAVLAGIGLTPAMAAASLDAGTGTAGAPGHSSAAGPPGAAPGAGQSAATSATGGGGSTSTGTRRKAAPPPPPGSGGGSGGADGGGAATLAGAGALAGAGGGGGLAGRVQPVSKRRTGSAFVSSAAAVAAGRPDDTEASDHDGAYGDADADSAGYEGRMAVDDTGVTPTGRVTARPVLHIVGTPPTAAMAKRPHAAAHAVDRGALPEAVRPATQPAAAAAAAESAGDASAPPPPPPPRRASATGGGAATAATTAASSSDSHRPLPGASGVVAPAAEQQEAAADEEEEESAAGGPSGMLAGIRGFNRAKLRSASLLPSVSAIAGSGATTGGGSGTPVGSGGAAAGGGGGGGGGGMPVSMFDRLKAVVEAKRAAHTGGRNLDAEEEEGGSDDSDSEWSVD